MNTESIEDDTILKYMEMFNQTLETESSTPKKVPGAPEKMSAKQEKYLRGKKKLLEQQKKMGIYDERKLDRLPDRRSDKLYPDRHPDWHSDKLHPERRSEKLQRRFVDEEGKSLTQPTNSPVDEETGDDVEEPAPPGFIFIFFSF